MKLEINLADRDEIAAAVPLLQMILEGTAAAPTPLAQPVAAPSIVAAFPLPTAPAAAPVSLAPSPAPIPPAATPAPEDSAPAAAAPTSPAVGVERDSKGLPWDERIHASTKTKIASGEWKAKRGVDDALVATVEAELRAMSAPVEGVPPAPVVITGADSQDPAAVFGGAAAPTPLPIAPPAAPSVPAALAAPSDDAAPTTFEQLMTRTSPLVVAGKLPPAAINQAATANGLANIVALQTAPQFVPLVWASLRQMFPAAFA